MEKFSVAVCPLCGNEYAAESGRCRPICPACGKETSGISVQKTPLFPCEAGELLAAGDEALFSARFSEAEKLYNAALPLTDDAHASLGIALARHGVRFDGRGKPIERKRGGILSCSEFLRALDLSVGERRARIFDLGAAIDGLYAFSDEQARRMAERGFALVGTRLRSYGGGERRVDIPLGVTAIDAHAFLCATATECVTVPPTVREIDPLAFDKRITSIAIENSEFFAAESGCVIDKRSKTLVTCFAGDIVPAGVEVIGVRAFQARADLRSLALPVGVKIVAQGAFDCCSALARLSLPPTLEKTEEGAFPGCKSLKTIDTGGNERFRFENGCFLDNASDTLLFAAVGCEIPDGVTRIGRAAFGRGHKHLRFPASVESGLDVGFCGCGSLETLTVTDGNRAYRARGNCIIDEKGTLVRGCNRSEIPTDGSITAIGDSAFCNLSGIKEIVLPRGVTDIGLFAFEGMPALERVVLPDTLKNIEAYAFDFCTALSTVEFGNGLEFIGNNAFDCCVSLERIVLPPSVERIERFAFCDCESLIDASLSDRTGWRANGVEVAPDCLDGTEVAEYLRGPFTLEKERKLF